MPNRILREGILSSERVAALGWDEEVFYRRLMSVVDDFGRYSANPKLLRAACYPLHLEKVSDADIGKWLRATEKAALVSVYPASDGKRYLELRDFGQQVRAKASKYPAPDAHLPSKRAADAQHVHSKGVADAPVFVSGDGDVIEDGGEGEKARKRAKPPEHVPLETMAEAGFDAATAAEFVAHKAAKKAPLTPRAWADHCREAEKAGMTPQQAAEKVMAKGWKGFDASYVSGRQGQRTNGHDAEPEWVRERRERTAQFAGPAAAKRAVQPETIDMEPPDASLRVG